MASPRIIFVTGNASKVKEVNKYFSELAANGKKSVIPTDSGSEGPDIVAEKVDLPELQGEPDEIAQKKCEEAYHKLRRKYPRDDFVVLTEDTSLCYNALEGLPGPYVKWFLDKTGCDGLNKILAGYEDKTAYAQTIFAITGTDARLFPPLSAAAPEGSSASAQANGTTKRAKTENGTTSPKNANGVEVDRKVFTFIGRTHGTIVPARGTGNFAGMGKGWDSIFLPGLEDQMIAAEQNVAVGPDGSLTYAQMTPEAKNRISHRSRSLAKLHGFLQEKGVLK
eukprot:g602.t1